LQTGTEKQKVNNDNCLALANESNGQGEGGAGGSAEFPTILHSLFRPLFRCRLARITECHGKPVQIVYLWLKCGPTGFNGRRLIQKLNQIVSLVEYDPRFFQSTLRYFSAHCCAWKHVAL
jgi:hypothetical protein